jgi:hypothetical protein
MSKHKIVLEFESDDARDSWLATYLDGGGEDAFSQYCDFSTASWSNEFVIKIDGTGEPIDE